jgi:DNA polymerase-3 subunit delta
MARKRSAPAAAGVLSQMRDRLGSGEWPSGLTTLTGDNLFFLDRAQKLLLDTLLPEEDRGYALTVLDGDEPIDTGTLVGAARSIGMFDPRRVVLLRGVDKLDGEPEAISGFAAQAPAKAYLIVRAPSLDRRRKLHKVLVESGTTLEFATGSAHDPARWTTEAVELAREKGLKLDRRAAGLLGQVGGGDLYRVDRELDKIGTWLGKERRTAITADVVREVVAAGGALSGWEVAEAITVRDTSGALAAARRLINAGEEPIRIVGGLAYRARSLLRAKALAAGGASFRQVVSAARAWSFEDGLRRGLRAYELEELRAFPALLLDADRTLKSRRIDARAVMERLVQRMTERPAPSEVSGP